MVGDNFVQNFFENGPTPEGNAASDKPKSDIRGLSDYTFIPGTIASLTGAVFNYTEMSNSFGAKQTLKYAKNINGKMRTPS